MSGMSCSTVFSGRRTRQPTSIRATSLGGSVAGVFVVAVSFAACTSAGDDADALGPITQLATPAGAGSGEPNLDVGADGVVYMSWLEPASDSVHALRFATLDGGSWSAPRTIATGDDWFVNWADFPSILSLDGDRLAAHYLQVHPGAEEGYHYDVRVVQSDDAGATWSDPLTPHRDGVPAEHGFVSLFPAGGDSVGAVWLDGRKSSPEFGGSREMTLRYTTIAPDGALGPEVVLDERICDCCQTSMARAASGPVVVYRDRTEEEIRDIYITRLVDGQWTEGQAVHDDGWEIAACPVNGPAISADDERVAVAWFTAARDTAKVLVAFSDDGGVTFGTPARLDGGSPAGRVDIELLDDGRAIVIWMERGEGEGAEVRARLVSGDGEMSEPIAVAASSGARASGFPRMARTDDGIVFAWTQPGEPARVMVAKAMLNGGE
jgi:hypothetical protein